MTEKEKWAKEISDHGKANGDDHAKSSDDDIEIICCSTTPTLNNR